MKAWILAALRTIAFWFGIATGVIGLAGLHAALNPELEAPSSSDR